MATHHDNEWIPEEAIAEQLGVDRDKVRAERPHLQAGEVKKSGNVIVWLRSAVSRVAEKLGLPLPEKTAPVAPVNDGVEELTVYSQPSRPGGPHFSNQFLIRAKRLNGELVVVRVLQSSKFLPRLRDGQPMTFKAKKATSGNWWVLVGREPRFPGAW